MRKWLWLRNVLIMVGAYYLAAWVLIPVWIPIANLNGGHVYQGSGIVLLELVDDIPLLVGAALAGTMAGYFLETSRPLGWAAGVGIFIGLLNWSSVHWHIKPSFADLLRQGIRAVVVGGVACVMCWLVQRRRRSVPGAGSPA
jgi:hypothetical protein